MLSNAYFLGKFRFDTAENEPAKNLRNFDNCANRKLTAPCVGRIPRSPQCAAGTRTEPVVSVPSATSTAPLATLTADPDEDPPT